MSSSDRSVRFVDDTRAVSAVVGAILMFGILILALATYQAAIVPQQNAQTEFQHFEDNRDELIEFRNAVSTAGQNNISQFPSIKLGTQYQSRTFTINPAPPAGTIQTSDSYNITIKETNGENPLSKNVSTRFVEYQPGYREISVGSTWYEHSVLYLDERESSGQNIIQDQNIVRSGGNIRITALQNEFRSSGTGRTTVELHPKNGSEFPEFDGPVTVKIPTRLDGDDYWNESLEGNSIYKDVEEYPDEDDVYRVVFEVDSDDNIEMNTVGIQDEPTKESVNNVPVRGGGGGAGGGNGASGGGDGSITDDSSLSFDGLPTAVARSTSSPGNEANEVEFNFEISNPDGENYQIVFGVRNSDGGRTINQVNNPSNDYIVTGGQALPFALTGGGGHLDVEMILKNGGGSVIDRRSGRINSRGNTITLS